MEGWLSSVWPGSADATLNGAKKCKIRKNQPLSVGCSLDAWLLWPESCSHDWWEGGAKSATAGTFEEKEEDFSTKATTAFAAGLNKLRKVTFSHKYDNKVIIFMVWYFFFMSYYPLGSAATIVVYYTRVFIQSDFSWLVLSGSRKSAWNIHNWHCRLLFARTEGTTVNCDSQSDLESAMPRPSRYMLNCDWTNTRESLKDLTNPSGPIAEVGEGNLLNRPQFTM